MIEEIIERYKILNEVLHIDKSDVPCNFNPTYKDGSKYEQESVIAYKRESESGYNYIYNLTCNGELIDLNIELKYMFVKKDLSSRSCKLKVLFDTGIDQM